MLHYQTVTDTLGKGLVKLACTTVDTDSAIRRDGCFRYKCVDFNLIKKMSLEIIAK